MPPDPPATRPELRDMAPPGATYHLWFIGGRFLGVAPRQPPAPAKPPRQPRHEKARTQRQTAKVEKPQTAEPQPTPPAPEPPRPDQTDNAQKPAASEPPQKQDEPTPPDQQGNAEAEQPVPEMETPAAEPGQPDAPTQEQHANAKPGFWDSVIDKAAELGEGLQLQMRDNAQKVDDLLGEMVQNDGSTLGVLGATLVSTVVHFGVDTLDDTVGAPLRVAKEIRDKGLSVNTVATVVGSLPAIGKIVKGAVIAKTVVKRLRKVDKVAERLKKVQSKADLDKMVKDGLLDKKSMGRTRLEPSNPSPDIPRNPIMKQSARKAAKGRFGRSYHWAHGVGRRLAPYANVRDNLVSAPAKANAAMIKLENALWRVADEGEKITKAGGNGTSVWVDATSYMRKGTEAGVAMAYEIAIGAPSNVVGGGPLVFLFDRPESMRAIISLFRGY